LPQQAVENCVHYNQTSKTCAVCDQDYLLSLNRLACLPNVTIPNPVPNCLTYVDGSTCLRCFSSYFLINNTCLPAIFNPGIADCLLYLDPGTCQECRPGYFSRGTICVKAVATNCLHYEDPGRCASCQPGLGFENSTGNRSCVAFNLTNCSLPNPDKPYPFECLACKGDNYLDPATRTCLPVTAPIMFCLDYSGPSSCKVCGGGLTLAPDFSFCYGAPEVTKILDPNCRTSALVVMPVCSVCAPGYFMSAGGCTPCKANQVYSGCMFCDPDDNDVCLLCGSGFYMDRFGKCLTSPGINTPK
jgi:hypothetical protein